ncbi:histidinol dehydrogenase [Cytobacillus firmus]|uniref:histidinol dehydrogenase n=2 Tax=Bacteria TaxID=2 RepID=UPI00077C4970|nr:histidinol dehydrogenase [Cytobacillus firmus]MBG9542363.1 histidinol dehydrogenase [Cytobacillus firmus]MBG9553578.1 histidinol dehydrogenase [Cytobacillus firmus]MBG9557686.1 histidinol dehydrogenase [Cytobacillus firmus]MBG9573964.1 histidinol dehydrogenase [Cytobacillus firmus]MDD9310316.1 histidinol dehydrogenase [Cytobacillus firmus]
MKMLKIDDQISIKRSVDNGTEEQRAIVKNIIESVRKNGDQALKEYTEKFDGISLDGLKVPLAEIEEALSQVDGKILEIIKEAAENIRSFHEKQLRPSWMTTEENGTVLGQKITPLDSVGLYVPGGTAAYPSSVLMNVIPAKVAGVKRIVITSPPDKKTGKLPPAVLAAAHIAGAEEIYKVGGAQAIAALAYGTESIRPVDKITGPGNIYVALAKREVFGDVDIDMIAGPSEIAILADDTAHADEVAADLLSQAEHDPMASAVLVTPSSALAEAVSAEVDRQLAELPRQEIAAGSISNYGAIYVTESMDEAVETVNSLAPEHLEILTENPMELLGRIRHAGAIFLGRFSPEPVGDYFAGPNHVLPTNGTARFSSPLNVEDFQKKSSILLYSEKALKDNGEKIAAFARLEGLEAHARSIETRLRK